MAHDPYYDLVPPPAEPEFDPSRTALLIIDLQYMDAHRDGWMGRLCREQGKPNHLDERWEFIDEILPRVRKLQDACRGAGIELVHIRVKYLTRDCRDGQRSLQQETKARSSDARDDAFLEMVAPVGDETIINKTSAGTFNSTPIDQVLRNMGRDRLLVCGIVTEGCVELTARDAADRGYFVTLVPDACASSTRLAHHDALQRMSDGALIRLRKVDELCAMIAASTPRRSVA